MINVETTIVIQRPKLEVADYASNPDNTPRWYENIKSVEWRTPKTLAVGSQIAFTAQFLRRKLEYVYEVVELLRGEKLVMRTVDGPFLMETTYLWEAVGSNATKMILSNRGEPAGFAALFSPFMKLAMRAANRKDLRRIKRILEQQDT
jgi:uncharacterized membrane protein